MSRNVIFSFAIMCQLVLTSLILLPAVTLRDIPIAIVQHASPQVLAHRCVPEHTPQGAKKPLTVVPPKVSHEASCVDHRVAFCAHVGGVAPPHVVLEDVNRHDPEAHRTAGNVVGPCHVPQESFRVKQPRVARQALQVQGRSRLVSVHCSWKICPHCYKLWNKPVTGLNFITVSHVFPYNSHNITGARPFP